MSISTCHASGTGLFERIKCKRADRPALHMATIYGAVRQIDSAADIVLLACSQPGFPDTTLPRGPDRTGLL
jgi:hypothetical protein